MYNALTKEVSYPTIDNYRYFSSENLYFYLFIPTFAKCNLS